MDLQEVTWPHLSYNTSTHYFYFLKNLNKSKEKKMVKFITTGDKKYNLIIIYDFSYLNNKKEIKCEYIFF